MSAAERDVDEEEEEEEDDDDDEIDEIPMMPKKSKARTSVSAEAFGEWNKKREFVPPFIPKSDVRCETLRTVLRRSFLFSVLEPAELDVVVGAMEEVHCEPYVRLITQGEDGDFLFIIEEGTLECKVAKDGVEQVVKTCEPGDAFGELALLYNCPRAASVDSTSACVLWRLDRETFNSIVRDAAIRKRERYEAFLNSVPLLAGLGPYERSQLSDALQPQEFPAGTYVLRQGEPGSTFYMIEEGTAVATKFAADGATEEQVMAYAPGDYFGELALLNSEERAANVIAASDVKLLTLDRISFKKLLGPLQDRMGTCVGTA
eukprot:TRINITY_DN2520_c0_g1_i1.p2 TRINITY_DN2520_c0_g1~~TRINITY_DN2520_c0_g1_i1.p2  ORF type:complete len:318 (+),score=100.98 TRINITY_DN2520_c0_g1_i1:107-1060(+)